ncbi:hypothetical protein ATCVGM07011_993R [Acanthocystis turfacea Chlorella virus GM0701.1]|nr:hypothetical protein ATCVGM07011_993R [Acanthocystis turfacea Chlorella virus GM0701.1]
MILKLKYYTDNGSLIVFDNYTVDDNGVVNNTKTGMALARHQNADGYNTVTVRDASTSSCTILVGRAVASTFLGSPNTPEDTVDHVDKNRLNDVFSNIRWLNKKGQAQNRTTPSSLKSAFWIVKDGVEKTARGWVEEFKFPSGKRYSARTILSYAQQGLYGFRYKEFPDLSGEEWRVIEGSKNTQGEWFISNMNRVKYKTSYATNVLTSENLSKSNGYPTVGINGQKWRCHVLSFITFFPEEYANKRCYEMILHKDDDKLNFRPENLHLGTSSDNSTDAHDNGKFDNKKTARKQVASYINGVLEKEHDSISAAVEYLRTEGHHRAGCSAVRRALCKGWFAYKRAWRLVT